MIKDHLGNEFKSIEDMCEYYGMSKQCYSNRLKKGMSKEEALTTPSMKKNKKTKGRKTTDHLGNEFDSITAMCKHYNIKVKLYRYRINNGWSLKDALTKPTKTIIDDGFNNQFTSIQALCDCHGIPSGTFRDKLKTTNDIREAIIATLHVKETVTDHEGKGFKSIIEMCKHHNVSAHVYYNRIQKNWSQKDALTTPPEKSDINIIDIHGKTFHSVKIFCKHHNISTTHYYTYKNLNYTMQECLNIIPHIGPYIKNEQLTDDLCVVTAIIPKKVRKDVKNIRELYFDCIYKNQHVVLKHDTIMRLMGIEPINI